MSGSNNGGDDKRNESTSKSQNVRERAKEIEDRIKRGSSVQNTSKSAKKTQDDKDRQGHKSISNPVLKEHAHTEWKDGALVTEVDTYIYDEDKSNEDKRRGNRSSVVAASTATKKADEEFFASAQVKDEEEKEFKGWLKSVLVHLPAQDVLGNLRSYVARRLVENEVATRVQVKENTVPKKVYEEIEKQRAAVKSAKKTEILERSGVRMSYAEQLDASLFVLNEGAKAASKVRGDSVPEETTDFYRKLLSIIGKDIKSSAPAKFFASTASAAASSLKNAKNVVGGGVNAMKRVGSKEDVLRKPVKGAEDDPLFGLELEEESTLSISGPTNVKKADSRLENGALHGFNKPFTRDTVHANEAKRKADEMAERRKVDQPQVQRTKKTPPPIPKRPDESKRHGYDGRPKKG